MKNLPLQFRVPPAYTIETRVFNNRPWHSFYADKKRFTQSGSNLIDGTYRRRVSLYVGTNGEYTFAQKVGMVLRRIADFIDDRITVAYEMDSFPDALTHAQKCNLLMKGRDYVQGIYGEQLDVLVDDRLTRELAPELFTDEKDTQGPGHPDYRR